MKKEKIAPFAVALAGCLWGMMGIFVRRLDGLGFSSVQMVGLRSMVTAIVLMVILFCKDKQLLKIELKDLWVFLGTGILSIVFFSVCYFQTILLSDLSVAAVLLYTAPAWVMVFSAVLFSERLTKIKIISVLMAFAGCILVTGLIGSKTHIRMGALLTGLGAGLGYALYSIFSRFAINKKYHSLTITFYTFLFSGVALVFFIQPVSMFQVILGSGENILFCILYCMVSTILPYLFYTWGLTYMENGPAAIIASVEPIVASVVGVFVFSEPMTLPLFLGIALVFFSIVIVNRSPR